MKKIHIKFCLCTLIILCNLHSFSQKKTINKLSDFIITISQNDKQILLESSKGCAWKELKFNKPTEQGIDNFGMSDGNDTEKGLTFYFKNR